MPLIITIIALALIFEFFGRNPQLLTLIFVAGFVLLCFYLFHHYVLPVLKKQEADRELERLAQEAQQRYDQALANWNWPTLDTFNLYLVEHCNFSHSKTFLPLQSNYLSPIFAVFLDLYEYQFLRPFNGSEADILKTQNTDTTYKAFCSASWSILYNFIQNAHPLWFETRTDIGPFYQEVNLGDLMINYDEEHGTFGSPEARNAITAIADRFSSACYSLESIGITNWKKTEPYWGTKPEAPRDPDHPEHWDTKEYSREIKQWNREYREEKKLYDKKMKEYEEYKTDTYDALNPIERVFLHTPFFPYSLSFIPRGNVKVPWTIPQKTRYSGMWVIAPPERGKTTLLLAMIMDDLKLVQHNQASIIILDSKGTLIDRVRRLKLFGKGEPLEGKLVIIDPDPDNPIPLNPLEMPEAAVLTYGQQQLFINRAITFLEYLFSAFFGSEMSPPQQRFFRACMRAVLEVFPNPTILDLKDLLENGYEKHETKIAKLDDRAFFSREQFYGSNFKDTRQALMSKVGLLLDNYALASMLKASGKSFNLAEQIDAGRVILINNNKGLLEDDGAEFFGRFFLYLLRKAVERRRLHNPNPIPCFCYLDEAHNVIKRDENVSTIVNECRDQNVAMIFAHQDLSQIQNTKVEKALANCAIIFANCAADAHTMKGYMHADTHEELNVPQGVFAAYVRDTANKAIPIRVQEANPEYLTAPISTPTQTPTAKVRPTPAPVDGLKEF